MLGIALVFIIGALGPYIYRYRRGKYTQNPLIEKVKYQQYIYI